MAPQSKAVPSSCTATATIRRCAQVGLVSAARRQERHDVRSSPGATGVVAAPLWGPGQGWVRPSILHCLWLAAQSRRRHRRSTFTTAVADAGDQDAGSGVAVSSAQMRPPSCHRRQTLCSAAALSTSAAVDSTLVCRWSSFSPSGWATAPGAEGDRHAQTLELQRWRVVARV